ncbi:LTA synthase family protein [Komagataeibacter europaeus]|uniref:LTA synthase family protein n=1 Tax=Komagataeibacter europaeus TaxID=33995 RepID=UPI0015F831DD|nr:LTA synthase family protein [Komagataeibacter europaeus]
MLAFQVLASFIVIVFLAPAIEYAVVKPRVERHALPCRWMLDTLCSIVAYGGWLGATGSIPIAIIMTFTLMIVTVVASNIKFRVLGEPLLFSDVVVARSFLQHPKFYLFSIPLAGRIALLVIAIMAPLLLWIYSSIAVLPHLLGMGMMLLGSLALWLCPPQKLAPTPDITRDVGRLGLPGSLIIYWRQWRASDDLPPPPILQGRPAYDTIMIVQCESFADPAQLGLPADIPLPDMPGLKRAYEIASRRGPLCVSGFGAYTMRSEYGVIFGQEETDLGFRRYDPFLTAARERAHAIGNRLENVGYRSTFVHPHDLRFYNRATLMPAMGFSRLVNPGPHAPTPEMPYFGDVALGQTMADMMQSVATPSLFYTVTMENHGPWPSGQNGQSPLDHYLRHVQNSDRMLLNLIEDISAKDFRALLVFFGDHRPSIPGIVMPSDRRDVPYVVISFPLDDKAGQQAPVSLTPAQLNHLIIQMSVRIQP